jgi:hypothetical protein
MRWIILGGVLAATAASAAENGASISLGLNVVAAGQERVDWGDGEPAEQRGISGSLTAPVQLEYVRRGAQVRFGVGLDVEPRALLPFGVSARLGWQPRACGVEAVGALGLTHARLGGGVACDLSPTFRLFFHVTEGSVVERLGGQEERTAELHGLTEVGAGLRFEI